MFPGKRKKDRKKLQDRFADDISHRAEAEATLLQKSCKDPSQMADKAAKAANAIIQCYMGNHSLCKKWSKICHGKYKFPYLPVDARGKLRMCTSDEQTIVRLLGKRIGQEAAAMLTLIYQGFHHDWLQVTYPVWGLHCFQSLDSVEVRAKIQTASTSRKNKNILL